MSPFCINLLPVDGKDANVEEEYIFVLSNTLSGNPNFGQISNQRIEYVQFKQTNSNAARSRVYSLDIYNPGSAETLQRKSDSIQLQLRFPQQVDGTLISLDGIYFKPRLERSLFETLLVICLFILC